VHMGTERVRGLARSYHEGIVGEPLALIGSSGHLELAVVQGSASAQLGMGRGARVRVTSLEST
ncbi:MAG TPA: SAM hydroxide adenosyltransferase, partial [Dongiaceae bacterium]|nr:SAM hydroxide adenosyltransferase [Dongiaceae bacterium]